MENAAESAQPLVASNITVKFGDTVALQNISATIGDAQCLGLLGANGSGKSTFARACTGYAPQRQDVSIAGYDPFASPARVRGYSRLMNDEARLPAWATPRQMIDFIAAVDPLFDRDYAMTIGDHDINLDKPVKTMSRGMRVLTNAILVFASRVRLLLFDEPTLGLDGYYRDAFFQRVHDRFSEPNPPGMLLTTHDVRELERCMTHALVLEKGKAFVQGSAQEITERYVVATSESADPLEIPQSLGHRREGGGLQYLVDAPQGSPEHTQLQSLAQAHSLKLEPASIYHAYQIACQRTHS